MEWHWDFNSLAQACSIEPSHSQPKAVPLNISTIILYQSAERAAALPCPIDELSCVTQRPSSRQGALMGYQFPSKPTLGALCHCRHEHIPKGKSQTSGAPPVSWVHGVSGALRHHFHGEGEAHKEQLVLLVEILEGRKAGDKETLLSPCPHTWPGTEPATCSTKPDTAHTRAEHCWQGVA